MTEMQRFLPEGPSSGGLRLPPSSSSRPSTRCTDARHLRRAGGGRALPVSRPGRTTLIPAITVPVSLISAFIGAWYLGFSINLITLLALILAIGLVVDDAIVVVENIHHHLQRANP